MPTKNNQKKNSSTSNTKTTTDNTVVAPADLTSKIVKMIEPYAEGNKFDNTIKNVDNAIGFILPQRSNYEYDNEVVKAASGPIKFGMWLFIIVFVFIGTWSALAPINSAAIAPGQIMLSSSSKTIDHLEGGIIESFSIKEGDFVEKGDELMRFNETKARASWEIQTAQINNALAKLARLKAERKNSDKISFPEELSLQSDNPTIAELLEAEANLFVHRKNSLEGQVKILKQRVKQFEEEIGGLRSQKTAGELQLSLINEEVTVVKKLVSEGKAIKPRLLALQREAAAVNGRIGEHTALIARARQSIAEAELSIIKLNDDFLSDNSLQVSETQLQIADLRERITAATDILDRTVVRAPRSGIITGLEYHTISGTVPPGRPLMTLVPQDDNKIVVARVSPQDIDVVTTGMTAKVRLSAYRARQVPPIDGKVVSISPDSFTDKNTGVPYFETRIELDETILDSLEKEIDLIPGMTAEVMIVTGTKTPLGYMFDPIVSSMNRAFKEE